MCMCVSVCMHKCICAEASRGQQRVLDPVELGSRKLRADQCGCWGLNWGSLKEQQVPLTGESLLQSSLCSHKPVKYPRGSSSSDKLGFCHPLIGLVSCTHFAHHRAWCFFQARNVFPWTLLWFEYASPHPALARVSEHFGSRWCCCLGRLQDL